MITIEKIEEMYSNMHNNGVDTDIKMLYGYFFTNSEPEKLKKVSEELKKDRFEYVDIYPDETNQYWLHMERIEIHNAKTLFELNKALYAIADKYGITSYDGFDLGNAEKGKGIERDTYVVPEEFETNDFQKNEMPFLIVANKAFKHFPHKNEFYYFLEIKTKYSIDNASKLPTKKGFEELNDFELFLESNLTQNGIKNYYVGRTTHNKERVFYIVTNEKEGAEGLLKFIKENGNQRQYKYEIIEDKEWNLYAEINKKLNKK